MIQKHLDELGHLFLIDFPAAIGVEVIKDLDEDFVLEFKISSHLWHELLDELSHFIFPEITRVIEIETVPNLVDNNGDTSVLIQLIRRQNIRFEVRNLPNNSRLTCMPYAQKEVNLVL